MGAPNWQANCYGNLIQHWTITAKSEVKKPTVHELREQGAIDVVVWLSMSYLCVYL